ncbi:hypothetical protein BGZ63DRAFT_467833 [Mariannaea sp. PMI_226]|nr:hypothetical protein BGZ63DRAFT_467833 [Mariannaea sp. PMI_226]
MAGNFITSFLYVVLALCLGVVAGPCRPPIDPQKPIRGGDFESGNPFSFSSDSKVHGSISSPGYNSEHMFRSDGMIDNNLLELYQDIYTIGGTPYRCTYNWWFDQYLTTEDYVPYLRIWFNNDVIGNRYPTSAAQTGVWMSGQFYFTSSPGGVDRIWIDAASPQPASDGYNHFQIDNIQCFIN